jgi:hypothetical protein
VIVSVLLGIASFLQAAQLEKGLAQIRALVPLHPWRPMEDVQTFNVNSDLNVSI